MIYTTILVQLDIDAPATPRLLFAQQIAKKFEADLIAVAAAEPSTLVSPSESSPLVAEVLRYRTHEIEERIKKLKEEFLNVVGNDERASWRAELNDPTRAVALHARAADLVITGAPTAAAAGDYQRTINPGALVLSTGRPVLFAADGLAAFKGERAMVAWKDCRESRRAVVDAMPFLRNAKEVTVFNAAEDGTVVARDGAADVVRFLMKHGVKARSQLLEGGGISVGDSIIVEADRIGADLIVAGGYGHSRFREWAFGGATRSLLSSGSFHRLLSN
ncbi:MULTISPECIES: universal stress protein [unclassified Mesorhizobium]|uniref:universal stress protein n=3 Tax=Mesorhizobium TaxID=68287 RepID=UPI000FCA60D5|nr:MULTISPECIES: universal stress protein [unclassified Mesorhizobium]MDG4887877.1 universal stress protein [Mesorhizobium sp. WSM4887]RUV40881.1 universal stress protein [Mesorhizobium sp. M1A.T.Ca.IN.004.03.1.1]RWK87117.1 MAG: universal stress protein [Mesorhizobium sp.]TIP16628.1 MAG: universal stress protein [Mesorhizobium sp.]TIQ07639.1 MAG: universal stress protein [Mesorhizobium sp.]